MVALHSKLQGDHIRFSPFDQSHLYLQVGSHGSADTAMSCSLPTTLKFRVTKATAALSPLLQLGRTARLATSAHLRMAHPDSDVCLRVPQDTGKLHGDQVTLLLSFMVARDGFDPRLRPNKEGDSRSMA